MKSYSVPDDLPAVCPLAVERLALELRDREQTRRIPTATAATLVLIVKLYEMRSAFPPRERIAAHLGVSTQTVDAVLSQRQATREIRIVHLAMKGAKQWTVRGRLVIPNPWLRKLVKTAEEDYRRMQQAMRPGTEAISNGFGPLVELTD